MFTLVFFAVAAVAIYADWKLGRVLSRCITAAARRLPYGQWLLVLAGIIIAAFAFTKLFLIGLVIAVGVGVYGYKTGKLPEWYRQAAETMGTLPRLPVKDPSKSSYKDYGTGLPR
jgi:hypothetical protein